jgi:hypothetical protein
MDNQTDKHPMVLVSPTGSIITGTLERLTGRANLVPGSAREDPLGGTEFDYDGYTEVFWDDQRTVVSEDERVFLDEEGNEFLEGELRLIPEESLAEEAAVATEAATAPAGDETPAVQQPVEPVTGS